MQRKIQTPAIRSTYGLDLLFLSIVIGSLFFIFLGSRPLFVPDEGRYAEIGREMLANNDFITPRLNDIIYFEKPAMFYWLGAIAYKIGGVSIWSIRSINALIGLAGTLLTYLAGRALYNRQTGLLAALILSSCLLYFVMSHMVSLDLPVTVFLTATLYAFLLGIQTTDKSRRYYFYAAAIAAALAVLTKGLIGIVFPTLIIGMFALTTKTWRQIHTWHLPTCAIIFLIVAAPWHILVQIQHPEFFHFYFIEQHFLRYTDQSIGHYEPIWFFIPYLLAGLLPWVVFLPQTIYFALKNRSTKQDQATWFFFLWAVIVFLFFSFSKSKLIPYILPVFPALSLLIAHYLVQRFYHPSNATSPVKLFLQNKYIAAIYVATWCGLVTLMGYASHLDTRTVQPLAQQLLPILKTDDVVVTYNQYYQDLPFYLEQKVNVLNWRNELSFGMQLENTNAWMITDVEFWKLWRSKKRVFAIISIPEFANFRKKFPQQPAFELGKTSTNVLISNQPSR